MLAKHELDKRVRAGALLAMRRMSGLNGYYH
jgi:hypothetical protein